MRRKQKRGYVLLGLLLGVMIFGSVVTSANSQCGWYRLGEPIVFMIEDERVSGWCCCCTTCPDTQILGWRVVNASGETIDSLEFDPVGYASDWDGTWSQTDYSGEPISAGTYTLYVKTSVGTLSRSLRLYDPCSGCWYDRCWGRSCCTRAQVVTIAHGCCRASLVLVQQKTTRCRFRLCSSCCP